MILKNWKLILAALSLAMFTACAGSSGGSDEGGDDEYSYEDDGSGTPVKKKKAVKVDKDEYSYEDDGSGTQVKKKKAPVKVDKDELKESEKEAMNLTEENHKLRKEIFDAKNKLGMPTGSAAEEDASSAE